MFCGFLGFLLVQNRSFTHFSIALFMAITKTTLSQFVEIIQTKKYNKHPCRVKMKNTILMEVLKSVTSLCGCRQSSAGIDYYFWVVKFLWVALPLIGVGLVYPTKVVTTSRRHPLPTIEQKILYKKVGTFFLAPPQCLLNIMT